MWNKGKKSKTFSSSSFFLGGGGTIFLYLKVWDISTPPPSNIVKLHIFQTSEVTIIKEGGGEGCPASTV